MEINMKFHSAGLCLTCDNNSSGCGFRKRRGFDAIYCEMFSSNGASPSAELRSSVVMRPTATTWSEAREPVTSGVTGLCVNCEHRDECTYSKPEGGVWHCEEYR